MCVTGKPAGPAGAGANGGEEAIGGGGEQATIGGDGATGGEDGATRDGGRPGKPLEDALGAGEPSPARSGSSPLACSSPVVSWVPTGDAASCNGGGLAGVGVGGGALTRATRTGAGLETATDAEDAGVAGEDDEVAIGPGEGDEVATGGGEGEVGAGDFARTGTGGGAGETDALGAGGAVTVGISPSGSLSGRPRPKGGTPGGLLAPAPSAPLLALAVSGLGTVAANMRARASWPPWLFSATVASGSKLSSTDSGRAAMGLAAAGSGDDGGKARGNFFPRATVGSSRYSSGLRGAGGVVGADARSISPH